MNDIEMINYHFSEENKSFLYNLYEKKNFDIKKYKEILDAIKSLKNNKNIKEYVHEKYDNCIWYSFVSNIIWRMHLLLNIEWDLREYWNELNISIEEYSNYMEKLFYELESLFFISDN